MSELSRRSLLGYTGTAAAGAVFASAGTAEASGRDAASGQEAQSTTTSTVFEDGTEFRAGHTMGENDLRIEMSFSVRVDKPNGYPSAQHITSLEVAQALSALAQSKGWPPLTFYGTPPPAPLN
ncbi:MULTISPECIES: hypothetical protein [unclassified Streptomyces]|uniref:hypothetical protein n=1 Tax=unclassified Streptomyces TaxID=2593676 RepID=UPI000DAC21C7|nr:MULTISPECIES: hypothetical protein [unclassified Streptomyces]PZT71747.1 hypothetical protein DNK55_31930 [Streptomyces sp. AC1-42T]PZT73127.1 hypothetical protein DNK56_33145 [Streptomyces sp. AC1-42W]